MAPSKHELTRQLAQANADKATLQEQVERLTQRLGLVFVISNNAPGWLEGLFGPLVDHGREQDEDKAVQRYTAVDETAAISFDPRWGDVIVTDPKELVTGSVTVRLNALGVLDDAGVQRITTFLDRVALSRIPRSTTRVNGPICFAVPRPKQGLADSDSTELAAADYQH